MVKCIKYLLPLDTIYSYILTVAVSNYDSLTRVNMNIAVTLVAIAIDEQSCKLFKEH